MTEEGISQQVQDQLGRLQQLQSQFQMIQQQRQQVEMRLKEIEEALTELNKAKEKTPIYKSVGSILIKTEGKKEIIKELESTKETLDIRKETLHKQIINFSQIIDKTTNNLNLNEMTTEMLGGTVTSFINSINTFNQGVGRWEDERREFEHGRKKNS